MILKQLTLTILLLSAITHKNNIAMEPPHNFVHLSREHFIPTVEDNHYFIIVNNIKHYAYPDPLYTTFKSSPIFYSQVFTQCLDKNIDWREKNGHSKKQIDDYHQQQLLNLAILTQQLNSSSNQ